MIPWAVIGVAAIAVARATQNGSGGSSGTTNPKDRNDPHWNWLVWFTVGPAFFFHALYFLVARDRLIPANLLLVPEVVLLFPWWIASRVAVPLGLVRTAYVIGALSDLIWSEDHRGGGAIAAAKAMLASGKYDAEAAAWIEQRINKGRVLKAGGVVACGLLAAARGDLDQARQLMESVEALDPAVCGRMASKLAAEWRADFGDVLCARASGK